MLVLAAFVQPAVANYDPTLGRWLERDPIGARPKPASRGSRVGFAPRAQYVNGMNLYQDVSSRPLRYLDPFGLREFTEEEHRIGQKINDLVAIAIASGKTCFAQSLQQFKEDLAKLIQEIPEDACDPCNVPIALAALKLWFKDPGDQWGEGWWDSRDYYSSNPVYAITPASQHKCNIFVAESIWRGCELSLPKYPHHEIPGDYFPPRASDWGDPDLGIPRFDVVSGQPTIGDICPIGGHVGIYLGGNSECPISISARDRDGDQ